MRCYCQHNHGCRCLLGIHSLYTKSKKNRIEPAYKYLRTNAYVPCFGCVSWIGKNRIESINQNLSIPTLIHPTSAHLPYHTILYHTIPYQQQTHIHTYIPASHIIIIIIIIITSKYISPQNKRHRKRRSY